ncbi:MAG TPA: TetR/AcrR family transcriptional regulator [Methanomassiliicoccales archaeon]|nr:TetR/AcrR family transcriptional regulator [Methanomassiliicoccales archaeon]
MPRTIKNPAVRRNEFITVAEELFIEKGFENTSIDNIVEQMDVAKGLFYHYFKTKDDLLNVIAERLLDEIDSSIASAMEKKGLTAKERFRALTPSNVDISDRSKMIVALFHKERNQAFHHLMEEKASRIMVPAVQRIIEQGVEEGMFHTDHPRESAMALVAMLSSLKKSIPSVSTPEQNAHIAIIMQELSERVLDAEPGTLDGLLGSPPSGKDL